MTRKRGGQLQTMAAPAEPEAPSPTEPPSNLSDAAKAWWRRATNDEYVLEDHHRRVLSEGAAAWDRAQQAKALVDAEGLVIRDRFGQSKPHPAVQIERDARSLYLRCCRELDLDGAISPESRPPRASRNRP
jgi:P27 family predicted phage terminase small subunit